MTMADTVAVMNQGHIEQLGAPGGALRPARARAFVANFLGQSNLGVGTIKDTDGDHLVRRRARHAGARSSSRARRCTRATVLFGVRPEKVRSRARSPEGAGNDVKGVVRRRVASLGVATQYLVDMPSGATWSCYEQNLDVEPLDLRPGDEVWLTWNPGHAFGVPADEARDRAGAVDATSRGRVVTAGVAHVAGAGRAADPPRGRRKRSLHGLPAAAPGRAVARSSSSCCRWCSWRRCRLQSRFPGFPGYYYRDLNFDNYASALTDYAPHFARSFLYAGLATFAGVRPRPTRWPTPWRSRPGAGAT